MDVNEEDVIDVVDAIKHDLEMLCQNVQIRLDEMSKLRDPNLINIIKNDILLDFLWYMPLDVDQCIYCKLNKHCKTCEYGKKHGICTHDKYYVEHISTINDPVSDYGRMSDARDYFEDCIYNLL